MSSTLQRIGRLWSSDIFLAICSLTLELMMNFASLDLHSAPSSYSETRIHLLLHDYPMQWRRVQRLQSAQTKKMQQGNSEIGKIDKRIRHTVAN